MVRPTCTHSELRFACVPAPCVTLSLPNDHTVSLNPFGPNTHTHTHTLMHTHTHTHTNTYIHTHTPTPTVRQTHTHVIWTDGQTDRHCAGGGACVCEHKRSV